MNVLHATNLEGFQKFKGSSCLMGIYERPVPENSDLFFNKLIEEEFQMMLELKASHAFDEIRAALYEIIPDSLIGNAFLDQWVEDMVENVQVFADLQNCETVAFFLGTKRGCRRYHVDKVPGRMIITYAGQGTEWLPNEAIDRQAYERGAPNEAIVLDKSARKFLNPWDIAIFREGPEGILHRTPDEALNGPSIFMRLDPYSYWENIL